MRFRKWLRIYVSYINDDDIFISLFSYHSRANLGIFYEYHMGVSNYHCTGNSAVTETLESRCPMVWNQFYLTSKSTHAECNRNIMIYAQVAVYQSSAAQDVLPTASPTK